MNNSSNLYRPYKAIGLVTDHNPFCLTKLGNEYFITTSINQYYQIFNIQKLKVVMTSDLLYNENQRIPNNNNDINDEESELLLDNDNKNEIISFISHNNMTFLCFNNELIICQRGKIIRRLLLKNKLNNNNLYEINQFILIGHVLIGLSINEKIISLFNWKRGELIKIIILNENIINNNNIKPTYIIHPKTYLNKILIGYSNGDLELWNINKEKKIYKFNNLNINSSIKIMESSPAIDVVAIGTNNGKIILFHLKYDEILFEFQHDNNSPVLSLSFRTDSLSLQLPILASSSYDGNIYLWNLKKKILHTIIKDSHDINKPVTKIYFLPKEPILISSGYNNSLCIWIFDSPDGSARLLKSRIGHQKPPNIIKYYGGKTLATMGDGSNGKSLQILSSSNDCTFRIFHTVRETQNREFSQKRIIKKNQKYNLPLDKLRLNPIIDFSFNETRENEWDNIITAHENDCNVYVWNFKNRKLSTKVLRQSNWSNESLSKKINKKNYVTSVCISNCGNYAMVGTKDGIIYRYNLESGQPRGSYPKYITNVSYWKSNHHQFTITGKPKPASISAIESEMKKESLGKVKMIKNYELIKNNNNNKNIEEEEEENNDNFKMGTKHNNSITGIEIDFLNDTLISSSKDGILKFWNFNKYYLNHEINVNTSINKIKLHKDNNILAISCDDFIIRLYDIITKNIIRRFKGFDIPINDFTFTPDGLKIIVAYSNNIKIWDISTSKCIDWLKFREPITSLTISLSGEFLCTSHRDRLGLYLWSDRTFLEDIFIDKEPTKPFLLEEGKVIKEVYDDIDNDNDIESDNDDENNNNNNKKEKKEIDLNKNILTTDHNFDDNKLENEENDVINDEKNGISTLSSLPKTYWHTLFNLELIKERNRPIEPPKKPERAPFFLPTTYQKGSVDPTFAFNRVDNNNNDNKKIDIKNDNKNNNENNENNKNDENNLPGWGEVWSDDDDDNNNDDDDNNNNDNDNDNDNMNIDDENDKNNNDNKKKRKRESRILKDSLKFPRSRLVTMLEDNNNINDITEYLESLTPPSVDLEIRSLCQGDFDDDGIHYINLFLHYIIENLKKKNNFEVIQTYLARVILIHIDVIRKNKSFYNIIYDIRKIQENYSKSIKELLEHNLCLIHYFSDLHS